MPARQRRVGLQELGLPYAADPAVTRHLARFLARRRPAAAAAARDPARPERARLSDARALQRRRDEGRRAARADRRGAERLAGARKGSRRSTTRTCSTRPTSITRSRAAPPTTAWRAAAAACASAAARRAATTSASRARCRRCPGLPAPLKALCVVPFGMEEGTSAAIAGREFGLVVGEPAEFRFLSSTVRKGDAPGTLDRGLGRRARGAEPARGDAAGSTGQRRHRSCR